MDNETLKEQVQTLYYSLHKVQLNYFDLWKKNILFTWRWWFCLALIIIPWILWFIVRKKNSSDRLLYAGFLSLILSSFLDMVGVVLALWSYPVALLPLMPGYIRYDFSVFPVVTMMFIQFFPKVKSIYKAIVFGMLGAFVFEPLMNWIGLYNRQGWKPYYSFPILFAIYLLCHHLAKRSKFDPI